MERRSFLKILGLVTGGALIHQPAIHEIERWVETPPVTALDPSTSEFFFRLNGIDFGEWINVLESRVEQPMIDVTSFMDDGPHFIRGIQRPKIDCEFANLPEERQDQLYNMQVSDRVVDLELGHRASGWSWKCQVYLGGSTDTDRADVRTPTFIVSGPVEIHAA